MPVIVLLPILLPVVWLTVAIFVVAVCRAAAYGDRSTAGGGAPQQAGGGRDSAAARGALRRQVAGVAPSAAPVGPRV